LTQLKLHVQVEPKEIISETLFLADLLVNTEETKPNTHKKQQT